MHYKQTVMDAQHAKMYAYFQKNPEELRKNAGRIKTHERSLLALTAHSKMKTSF